MKWDIEYTDEFGGWWATLIEPEQESVKASVELLSEFGPNLRYPYSSGITTSKHDHLRELRIQHAGRSYRVLYAFDPRRCAILLLGGDKTGHPRWYDEQVPVADRLYDEHLATLKKEGLLRWLRNFRRWSPRCHQSRGRVPMRFIDNCGPKCPCKRG